MPRFQFTIRGLLWATLWVAVTAALLVYVTLAVQVYNEYPNADQLTIRTPPLCSGHCRRGAGSLKSRGLRRTGSGCGLFSGCLRIAAGLFSPLRW